MELFDDNPEYQAFVEKFKLKKTTDDCCTPENIYDAILEYATVEYGFSPEKTVRPFWPGGDYERFDYPSDCVVVDNPPFSILAKIIDFYLKHNIRFFLFCQSLTSLGVVAKRTNVTLLQTGCQIVYENGATVVTSFATNLDDSDIVVKTVPKLARKIEEVNKSNVKTKKKLVRKLIRPNCILTGAKLNQFVQYGINYVVRRNESTFIQKLDNDSENIFGGGLLLSEKATLKKIEIERIVEEKSKGEQIELSDRESALQRTI